MTAVATPAEDEGSCEGSCDNGLISGGKLCGEEDKDSFGSGLVSGCVTMPGTDRREDEDGFRSGLISGGTLLGVGRFCGGEAGETPWRGGVIQTVWVVFGPSASHLTYQGGSQRLQQKQGGCSGF